ncbi:MAG: hypothetical protein IT318_16745 [Anaerolineales bacterium]|nr:hypothetical protein [Anaerolineales bacterium]
MTSQAAAKGHGQVPAPPIRLNGRDWAIIGMAAAAAASAAVVAVQAMAIALWPEIALFKPLDSYPRSILFTTVPALGAAAVLAWLAARQARPGPAFIRLSLAVLLLSFIPDYALPAPHKTVLASSVAACLHVVAGLITMGVLLAGHSHKTGQCARARASRD